MDSIDTDVAVSLLSAGGPLARQGGFFEERPEQIRLLKRITDAFNQNLVGVFEAGTGVGKSYAYLIPAILFAAENEERVVISTGTINLQQQLAQKDVPQALKICGKNCKYLLLKGRQNYVCLRRLEDALQEKELFTEETDELEAIAKWTKTTADGSRSDLSFLPSENVWGRVNSESDACMGRKCPHLDQCFVMRLRKEAASAQILIVNHHLLFADIEMRLGGTGYDDTAVLPPYRYLVFDEAHGIEDAATSFFSETINRFKIVKQLNLLHRQRKGVAQGLLFTVDALATCDTDLTDVVVAIDDIKAKLLVLEDAALLLTRSESTWRLYSSTEGESTALLNALDGLRVSIADFCGLLRKTTESVAEKDQDVPAVWEVKQIVRRIEAIGETAGHFLEWAERSDTVFWIERRRLSNGTYFPNIVQTPLEIAAKMNEGIFEPLDTVVCTSATLTVGGDFSYWFRRSGVAFADKDRVLSDVIPSPFPYRKNMLLCVPFDAPLPSDARYQSWVESAVPRLILASEGRALVLFTSYDMLKYTGAAARNALQGTGIPLLMQGDDDRFKLLESFKSDTASVLFATDSFWEGVDVPGESLSQVIIVKLPFQVPSDPVFAARSKAVEDRGGSSFMELSVPDAVVHFRQGVGRLIRRSTDRGAVTVLDSRLVRKQYGSLFLRSIPESAQAVAPLGELCGRISRFLEV